MKDGSRVWFVGLSFVILVGGASLVADTLVMKDGRRIRGQLRSVRDGVIEFVEERFLSSRTIRVDRDDVARIEFDDADRGASGRAETPERPRGLRERDVSVPANVAWTDTGIDVRSGQDVYFVARGRVRWGPDRRDGASGERDSPYNANRPIPRRPAAALIGRIGEASTEYFFIGDEQGAIRMHGRGRLFLGLNDDYLLDNSGALTVTVYY